MEQTLHTPTPFAIASVREIIQGLQDGTGDSRDQQFYQFEFYNRLAPIIFRVLSKKCAHFADGDALAKDVLNSTFKKALANIRKFKFDPAKCPDGDYTKPVCAWVNRIAHRTFIDLYKKEPQVIPLSSIGSFEEIPDSVNLEGEPIGVIPNVFYMQLDRAMQYLSDMDRHIIITYAGEGCLDSTKHLSDPAFQMLCKKYNISPQAIRQRKKRALDKIKTICFTDSNQRV